jgi:predicted nucleic acid-binding protein
VSIVVADTGALYALVDVSDVWHKRVVEWWRAGTRNVIVPVTVLPEVSYLLQQRIGPAAEERFIRAVAEGEFVVESLESDDVERAADLMAAYSDFPLGFVDASIVAIAERNETSEVLTTDRRHFTVVRPGHVRRLILVP